MVADPSLDALNPEQRAAVLHDGGPLLILAGAGSGKTRVITHRIAHRLREGRAADSIVALTFTNKAAREMRERTTALAGASAERVHLSTFHSACARWLRRYAAATRRSPSFSIYDEDDQLALVRDVAERLGMNADAGAARELRARLESAAHRALRARDLEEDARSGEDEQFVAFFRAYHEALQRANAFDFGSLVTSLVHAFEDDDGLRDRFRRRIEMLVVDEFQDTNTAQYRLLRHLARPDGDVAVVGDDDQSIYRWRGATVENVHAFQEDFAPCEVVTLEENYRSGPLILSSAHAIVSRVATRMPKELRTSRTDETPLIGFVGRDDAEEADFVAQRIERERIQRGLRYGDFAVFVRTNAQTRVLEERFRRAGVQHEVVGSTSFFARKEIKDVVAYLRVAANPRDDVAFLRVANVPARGLGKQTLSRVRRMRDLADLPSLLDASRALLDEGGAGLGTRAKSALRGWVELVDRLHAIAAHASPYELLEAALTESRYLEALRSSKDPDAEDRERNVEDLRDLARSYDTDDATIADFLESTALARDVVTRSVDGDDSRVALMTVHASKGLEFPVVFVTGLEDNTFPLKRRDGGGDDADDDEERRLCYVAFTRAEHQLYVTAAQRRRTYGRWQDMQPSPYLAEIPDACVTMAPESAAPLTSWGRTLAPQRRERQATFDEFDQRPWQERVSDAVAAVPEEGLVFGDDTYPDEVFDATAQLVDRRVHHRTFGVGRVVDAERTAGKTRLTIDFGERGSRKVVREYVEFLD